MANAAAAIDDASVLRHELHQLETCAQRMEQVAVAALHVYTVSGRERTFAATLLRNAKGARLAAAAWSQEVRNR